MDYKADIAKYASDVDEKAVAAIVKFCGIALKSRDSSLVSVTDTAELDRIRKGFATKALKLGAEECEKAIKAASEKMKAEKNKQRVTFYYLLAEAAGKLKALG
jgi:hypothetical protein